MSAFVALLIVLRPEEELIFTVGGGIIKTIPDFDYLVKRRRGTVIVLACEVGENQTLIVKSDH